MSRYEAILRNSPTFAPTSQTPGIPDYARYYVRFAYELHIYTTVELNGWTLQKLNDIYAIDNG